MSRQSDPQRIQELYSAVEAHPGRRAGFLARLLGLERSTVTRTLPTLEEAGYLLSEDEDGRLYPFRRISGK